MNFYKKLTPFNKVFFIIFLLIDIILFMIPAFTQGSMSILFTLPAIITFICSVSGILMAIYNAEASLHFFIWGLVNTTTYTYITFIQSLYGQVIVTAFAIIPVQIVGLYIWTKNSKANGGESIKIKKFTKKLWINHIIFFVLGSILYAFFLLKLPYLINYFFSINISSDKQPIMDSINAIATLLAMYTGAQRYIEQWLFWIIANTTGIIIFIISFMHSSSLSIDSISTAIMWLQLEINTFYGYYHWKKSLAK
ncbi:nicotinamide riboside transporter PnuC [uncultured Clostridium sp.]|uniref:nicotinamide riboside transporter PnuC n=1 Tax=uncultured Clostridium sp. TaxID=59620 RepID=UPI00263171B9|nr:nicotinamide riboside transporter PnuC [uncultured Clostridium sp.]